VKVYTLEKHDANVQKNIILRYLFWVQKLNGYVCFSYFFHFPLSSHRGFFEQFGVREGAGGKPARVEAAGDAAAKKRL